MKCSICQKDLINTHRYIFIADMNASICYRCYVKRHKDFLEYVANVLLGDFLKEGGDLH